jgi:putative DNA primase/helicase
VNALSNYDPLSSVPDLLKEMPNWVSWKLTEDGDKPLFVAGTNRHASSTDSSTWTDFITAMTKSTINRVEGLGFVIGGTAVEKHIVGVDIDGCLNPETDAIAPWADKIVDLLDSYTERTPSGLGLRVWTIGDWPFKEHKFNLSLSAGYGDKVGVEVYNIGRYFTVTGNKWFNEDVPVEKRNLSPLYNLCREVQGQFSRKTKSQTELMAEPTRSESVKVEQPGSVITNKYELLMRGTVTGDKPLIIRDGFGNSVTYGDRSAADLALCTLSALKHGNNPDAIWNDYENSSLFRPKWEEREEDFRKLTIANAISTAERITRDSSTKTEILNTQPQTNAVPNSARLWDRATPFSDIEDTPLEFIIPGLITKGESTMMTGDFGSFKSYMTYFIADAITEGGMFVRRTAQKHPVLVLDRENSKSTISLRRYLVGNLRDKKNAKLLGRFTNPQAPEINSAELLELCQTIHPFIIIDSMQDFHPGKKENDTDDMTAFSLELNELIDAGAAGVLIIHHVPKAGKGKGGKYRGATAIPGGVGGALFVEKVGRTGVRIEGFKTRDGEDSLIELLLEFPTEQEIKAKTGRVTYKIVKGGLDRSAELKDSILAYVQAHVKEKLSRNKIAKGIGRDRVEIYGVINGLIADERLVDAANGICLSESELGNRGPHVSF